ncbi:hypothetical protein cce_4771 [Crocosphaera subtropica ATCC 51142]|uniref:Uncharacterized protein n=1 Tax=Crocosphaera subtropica (strain ATCC 51142 / BH68) TaxID=43989 RepID=B1X1V8_CROS5|nr:hypothetical protein [Crocosphaera subtropica]ACB54119.1 hypothetical protein cce_4771 [Crocosphaera subtropica ATCC 51142]
MNFEGLICEHNRSHPYYRFSYLPENIKQFMFTLILTARGSGIKAISARIKLEKFTQMSNEDIISLYQESFPGSESNDNMDTKPNNKGLNHSFFNY